MLSSISWLAPLVRNGNFFTLTVLPPATLLWLAEVNLLSLWKVVTVSLVLQLLLSVVSDALLSGNEGLVDSVMRWLAHAVVDPLVAVQFFSWVLRSPRVTKAFGITAATEKVVTLATNAEVMKEKKKEIEDSAAIARVFRNFVLAATSRIGQPDSAACMAMAVPWYATRFVLSYWSSWYGSMDSMGDSVALYFAMFELFFYFMACWSMALLARDAASTAAMVFPFALVAGLSAAVVGVCYAQVVPGLQPGAWVQTNLRLVVSVLWCFIVV